MATWQHGAPVADVAIYMEDAFQLFHTASEDEYDSKLAQFRLRWDALFEQYFMNSIHPDVPTTLGRWVLESLHIYNPYSGVTNN